MSFGTLSGLMLIRYSTTLWVYLGIRFFYCLAFIIGIMWLGAKLKQKNQPINTQPQKSRFVSLGIGWSPRKEERRKGMIAERREDKRTAWIASLTLIVGIGIGYAGTKIIDRATLEPLRDVLITSVHADGSYTMVDGAGREFETTFCHGRDDLVAGNKLETMYYRQETGCKNVRGKDVGYKAYTHKDGTRIIFPITKETADVR